MGSRLLGSNMFLPLITLHESSSEHSSGDLLHIFRLVVSSTIVKQDIFLHVFARVSVQRGTFYLFRCTRGVSQALENGNTAD